MLSRAEPLSELKLTVLFHMSNCASRKQQFVLLRMTPHPSTRFEPVKIPTTARNACKKVHLPSRPTPMVQPYENMHANFHRRTKIQTENQKVNSWSIADARGMPVHVTAPHHDPEFKVRH
jgi:hypothetical protein